MNVDQQGESDTVDWQQYEKEAQQAITQLNESQFEGRALAVNEARPKPQFAGGGGGGGGYDRGNGGGPRRRSEPRW